MVKPIEELVTELSKLPAIGKKSAWRLALHLLEVSDYEVSELASAIGSIKERVHSCKICAAYSEDEVCPICASEIRTDKIICVVEKAYDVFTFEKSNTFKGKYHVLGGLISPINGITPDKLRILELKNRILSNRPDEIILGLGGSSEAETTAIYLSRILSEHDINITRLARGLPAGMDLEYVDELTLNQAMNERTDF